MENTFLDSMKRDMNYTETENGGITHKSTLDAVYDMFALGGGCSIWYVRTWWSIPQPQWWRLYITF